MPEKPSNFRNSPRLPPDKPCATGNALLRTPSPFCCATGGPTVAQQIPCGFQALRFTFCKAHRPEVVILILRLAYANRRAGLRQAKGRVGRTAGGWFRPFAAFFLPFAFDLFISAYSGTLPARRFENKASIRLLPLPLQVISYSTSESIKLSNTSATASANPITV